MQVEIRIPWSRPGGYAILKMSARVIAVIWLVGQVGCNASKEAGPPAPSPEQEAELAARYPEANLALGRRVYLRQCSTCHQLNGEGLSNAIPPLRGHLPALASTGPGRAYIAGLVLYGVNGMIDVRGKKYMNVMPALKHLYNDAELAAAVNYALLTFADGAEVPQSAWLSQSLVAAARAEPRSDKQMLAQRQQTWPQGVPFAPPTVQDANTRGPTAPKSTLGQTTP